jgi:hypothetical protein
VSYNGRTTKELIANKYIESIVYVIVGINVCIKFKFPFTIGSEWVLPNSIAFPTPSVHSRGIEYRRVLLFPLTK